MKKKNKVGRPKEYKKTVVIPLRIEESLVKSSKKKAVDEGQSFNRYMNTLIENDLKK